MLIYMQIALQWGQIDNLAAISGVYTFPIEYTMSYDSSIRIIVIAIDNIQTDSPHVLGRDVRTQYVNNTSMRIVPVAASEITWMSIGY